MTVKELSHMIGKFAAINQGGLTVNVRITDVKNSYGTLRYEVTPVSGSGSVWVDASRVTVVTERASYHIVS